MAIVIPVRIYLALNTCQSWQVFKNENRLQKSCLIIHFTEIPIFSPKTSGLWVDNLFIGNCNK